MIPFRQFFSRVVVSLEFTHARKNKVGILYSICNQFCHSVYSPELPDWFLNPKANNLDPNSISDDEFVLPDKLVALNPKKDNDITWDDGSTTDFYAEINEIAQILSSNVGSPESVLLSLRRCSIKVSDGLVNKVLCRFSNDWMCAFGFFMWARAGMQPGYNLSPESYNTMVDILGKFKQFDLMWGLISEMAKIGGLVSLETMKKAMRRLAGAGWWIETINAFMEIERFGVKRDTLAMNVLLDTLCKERSVRRAHEVFVEMKGKIPPDGTTFNCLIHGWCKARKLDRVHETLKEMQELGFAPCVIAYTSLIEAYCLDKNFAMVISILEEMQKKGCAPNVITYTIIMHSLGKTNQTKEALRIYKKMKTEGIVPDTSCYNSLIYTLGRAGGLSDAYNLFDEMNEKKIAPDTRTYNTLISITCDHGEITNALKLLAKMSEENLCKHETRTYFPILKFCCKMGWAKIILFLLGHMFRRDISLDLGTYTLLINRLCRNGYLAQSCMFFEEMVLKGLVPKEDTYNRLIESLERKEMDEAKKNVEELMTNAQNMKGFRNLASNMSKS
ncbi:hypothetical protein LUZ63_007966 [Rhynchospora breviuscula]|uniref:Pentatricopeptide repeat-containing protein n=1 Tax=Rhynchospora breviuscula TaxID=2022672 RepID=A0A9Q0CTW6_9POAL|nr:hypothetical protein LUZ63_007966 [Rhynchospora breviuscula]